MTDHTGTATDPYVSWAERNGFSHWAIALAWIITAFILFQVMASIVSVILIMIQEGGALDPSQAVDLLLANLDLVFIGNSSGQILFLGLCTWFVTRLHTSRAGRPRFLRFTWYSDTIYMIGMTVLLILAVQPLIWFLSWLNTQIPVPEFFTEMQTSQMEMIEQFLTGDHLFWLTLFHVAIVPAVCEEVLYRGYVMRAFEKSWGIWPAIIISGLLFGLYHVQLTNLLPLASIGILLAAITWYSGSIYPAMVAHFVNNGSSVMIGTFYPESAFAEMTPESMPPVWAVVASLLVTAYIIHLMVQKWKARSIEESPDV